MTEKEQIEHLKDQIFKLQMVMKGASGIAAAGSSFEETSAFNKQSFKRITFDIVLLKPNQTYVLAN